MNIDQAIMQASAALSLRVDAAGEVAHEAIRQHAAREIDHIKVRVGWMIRSDGQKRRWRGK